MQFGCQDRSPDLEPLDYQDQDQDRAYAIPPDTIEALLDNITARNCCDRAPNFTKRINICRRVEFGKKKTQTR